MLLDAAIQDFDSPVQMAKKMGAKGGNDDDDDKEWDDKDD